MLKPVPSLFVKATPMWLPVLPTCRRPCRTRGRCMRRGAESRYRRHLQAAHTGSTAHDGGIHGDAAGDGQIAGAVLRHCGKPDGWAYIIPGGNGEI